MIYRWNSKRGVVISEDLRMSQFDLIGVPSSNESIAVGKEDSVKIVGNGDKLAKDVGEKKIFFAAMQEYSVLLVSFHLQRHMGNFLIQVYGPCICKQKFKSFCKRIMILFVVAVLVVLSWVSFWLNREATADRVSLGITTNLTMTFLGLEARADLPKVSYPTALDFFVFLSFAFIFATILQFAIGL